MLRGRFKGDVSRKFLDSRLLEVQLCNEVKGLCSGVTASNKRRQKSAVFLVSNCLCGAKSVHPGSCEP